MNPRVLACAETKQKIWYHLFSAQFFPSHVNSIECRYRNLGMGMGGGGGGGIKCNYITLWSN